MLSETASEEIGRMDELPVCSTARSLKSNETEDDDEEVDHVARIHEFFSRDSVIISALVVQCIAAILSFKFIYHILGGFTILYKGMHRTIPLPTKIFLIFFSSDILFDQIIAIILFTVLPFIGIYLLFKKRKKLFFYYFLATFPPEVLILFFSFYVAIVLSPIFQIDWQMK